MSTEVQYADVVAVRIVPNPAKRPVDGYGNKIPTDYQVQLRFQKAYRKVYAICHSNVASFYVLVDGATQYVRDAVLQVAKDASHEGRLKAELARLEAMAKDIAADQAALKKRSMIYQCEEKEAVAIANGLPLDAYYEMSVDAWRFIANKHFLKTRGVRIEWTFEPMSITHAQETYIACRMYSFAASIWIYKTDDPRQLETMILDDLLVNVFAPMYHEHHHTKDAQLDALVKAFKVSVHLV